MADRDDFMIDEDLSGYDDFSSISDTAKRKRLGRLPNTAKHKLPPHLRDQLLKPRQEEHELDLTNDEEFEDFFGAKALKAKSERRWKFRCRLRANKKKANTRGSKRGSKAYRLEYKRCMKAKFGKAKPKTEKQKLWIECKIAYNKAHRKSKPRGMPLRRPRGLPLKGSIHRPLPTKAGRTDSVFFNSRGRGGSRRMARVRWISNCVDKKVAGSTTITATGEKPTKLHRPNTYKYCHNKTRSMRMRKGGYGKFMERCTGKKQPSPILMGKPIAEAPDLSKLKGIGIAPSIIAKLKDIQKKDQVGAKIKESEKALVKDVNETILPVVDQIEKSVTDKKKKKKPPYLLYGALGVVGLIIAIRVLK